MKFILINAVADTGILVLESSAYFMCTFMTLCSGTSNGWGDKIKKTTTKNYFIDCSVLLRH